MAKKYDLTISLENLEELVLNGKRVEGICLGSQLQGTVHFTAVENVNARGLHLEIGYNEHGNGTPCEHQLIDTMFFKDDLVAGQPMEHRFVFPIPDDGPVTYHGKYVNFDWFVRIRVDIPFWPDKREKFPFIVLPRIRRKGRATSRVG
ncbi:MAG: hypothetical protein HYU64_19945 [Armatimonadetes bacterium]|nr:hypothetical protein [Armatimonadota bacterium]